MKKKISLSLLTLSVFIIGCGNNSSNNNENKNDVIKQPKTSIYKEYEVIDSYVIGANVCDEFHHCYPTQENGKVSGYFDKTSKHIFSSGGQDDANLNGTIDSDDFSAINMKTNFNAYIISPLTTLIVDGLNEDKLLSRLNLNDEDIFYNDPIKSQNLKLLKLIEISSLIILKNQESDFIREYNKGIISQLPDADVSDGFNEFVGIAKYVIGDPKLKNFIDYIASSNENNAINFISDIENVKKSYIKTGVIPSNIYNSLIYPSNENNIPSNNNNITNNNNDNTTATNNNISQLPDVDGENTSNNSSNNNQQTTSENSNNSNQSQLPSI